MNYSKRRDRLADKLPPYSLFMVCSGKAPYKAGDELYPFEVNRDFYYLTGIDEPKLVYLLWKDKDGYTEELFTERFDPVMAKWVGGKIQAREAAKISGIDAYNILYLDQLDEEIGSYLNRFAAKNPALYPCLRREETAQDDDELTKRVRYLQRHYPSLKVYNASPIVTEMRLVKDAEEIKELRKGIHITNEALKLMWKNLKPGMNESEAEAWFDFTLKKERMGHSFDSIFGSGKNATVLHYASNNCVMKDGTLLLTDLGASSRHYCADISRTVPVNGTFTPRQRQIYDTVLACNRHIIDYAKNGMTLRDLHMESLRFYERELPKLGLLKRGKTVRDYYWHSVGHMLGLETHDVAIPEYTLRNGNVFTVEPGLYLEEEGIGVRIEDNVVMKNGRAEVLSAEIMKDPDEIEAFFRNR
ncbi:MAG: aminopeptidase P N-terminal domain-containing protein [Erysipelotrichales bacterium]|nr:aminopeptidase P N-terminal domain-containing protein [Erysipelotrichales bacterium]